MVVGYHALTAGSVSRAEAPERIDRGLAGHPVDVVVLGRLAVDHCWTVSRTPVCAATPPMLATTAASPLGRLGTVTLN